MEEVTGSAPRVTAVAAARRAMVEAMADTAAEERIARPRVVAEGIPPVEGGIRGECRISPAAAILVEAGITIRAAAGTLAEEATRAEAGIPAVAAITGRDWFGGLM
jgi:hypothetical protein